MVDPITEWEYHNPIVMKEYIMNDYAKLIDNAWEAYHNSSNEWAKNYWTTVANALVRKAGVN